MNITTKSREQYILKYNTFTSRYKDGHLISTEWQRFELTGLVDAYEWKGNNATFVAPWGEQMIINPGDFLCRVPDSCTDVYRIARDEFFDTYKPL